MFITIEGIDGVGKTTLREGLRAYFESHGQEVVVLSEPGGTEIAQKIREIILSTKINEPMHPETELLLFFAARKQNIEQNIIPALKESKLLIVDRFYHTTLAYQCFAKGVDLAKAQRLIEDYVQVEPELILWLDAPVGVGNKRLGERRSLDRMELLGMEFFQKVREGFVQLHKQDPKRIKRIDAEQPIEDLLANAIRIIEEHKSAKLQQNS